MKHLYTATTIVVWLPSIALAIGMGNINVESFLNQPFRAEIPLIDAKGVQLDSIKVSIASLDNFERVGIELNDELSLLKFNVVRNSKNNIVIAVTSDERITEPYLQLIVDLAWPKGQLYRVYTVLLDPPGYKLATLTHSTTVTYRPGYSVAQHQPGVIDKPVYTQVVKSPISTKSQRKQSVYGPTRAYENIWQIAQRYLTPETTLPQVILAIVGTNSQAFTQGNLNGLKVGERLLIPSNDEVVKVPADLAKQEVDAQDTAWKSQQEIKHRLLPPYIDGQEGSSQFSKTQSLPAAKIIKPLAPSQEKAKVNANVAMLPLPQVTVTVHQTASVLGSSTSMSVIQPVQNASTPNEVMQPMHDVSAPIPTIQPFHSTPILMSMIQPLPKTSRAVSAIQSLGSQQQTPSQVVITHNTQPKQASAIQPVTTLQKDNTQHKHHKNMPLFWLYLLFIAAGMLASIGLWSWWWLTRRDDNLVFEHDNPNPPMPLKLSDEANKLLFTDKPPASELPPTPVVAPQTAAAAQSEPSITATPVATPKPSVATVAPIVPLAINDEPALTSQAKPTHDQVDDQSTTSALDLHYPDESPTKPDKANQDATHDTPSVNESEPEQNHLLEFEPGLDKVLAEQPKPQPAPVVDDGAGIDFLVLPELEDYHNASKQDAIPQAAKPSHNVSLTSQSDDDYLLNPDLYLDANQHSFDDKLSDINLDEQSPKDDNIPTTPSKPTDESAHQLIKSKAAMGTLLALAKTYLSMDDVETARESLQEVVEYGNESQQQEAQQLLDSIKSKE